MSPATNLETRQHRTEPLAPGFTDDPLLTARESAAYRRQGLSTFWRDVRAGTVPQPIRVTPKAPRWKLSWLAPQHADAA